MITLYYLPGTCSLAEHIVLEWLGLDYESHKMSRAELKSAEYLRLNPSGTVPTVMIEDRVYTENAAIMLYLARQHPQLWGQSLDEEARATQTRWLAFLTGTLHPHFWPFFNPGRFSTHADEAALSAVKAAAMANVARDFEILEAYLHNHSFLGGETPSMVDAMAFPMLLWGYKLSKPTSEYPHLEALFRHMLENPGVQRAVEIHGIQIPESQAAD